jgi:hypothetical protein
MLCSLLALDVKVGAQAGDLSTQREGLFLDDTFECSGQR